VPAAAVAQPDMPAGVEATIWSARRSTEADES
jgi:hypothetical protein